MNPKKLQKPQPCVAHQAKHPKPAVAPPNPGGAQLRAKHPTAPPAYRPQPVPKVLQRKIATAQATQSPTSSHKPTAPPAYRPHPVPLCLQMKQAQPRAAAPVKPASARHVVQKKLSSPIKASRPVTQVPPRSRPAINRNVLQLVRPFSDLGNPSMRPSGWGAYTMIDCDGGHVSFFTSHNVTPKQKKKLDKYQAVELDQIQGAQDWQFEGFHVTLDVVVEGEAGRMHHFYTENGGIDLSKQSAPSGYPTWLQANAIASKIYKRIYNKDVWVGTLHKATGVYEQYARSLEPDSLEYDTAKTYEFWASSKPMQ